MIRRLELSIPSPNLGGRVRGLRLSAIIHLANDLIKVNGYINRSTSRQRTIIQRYKEVNYQTMKGPGEKLKHITK